MDEGFGDGYAAESFEIDKPNKTRVVYVLYLTWCEQ